MENFTTNKRKGQFIAGFTITPLALLILVGLMMAALIVYLIYVQLPDIVPMHALGEPGGIKYDLSFIKAGLQPYAYLSAFAYSSTSGTVQALMCMYAGTNKYFSSVAARLPSVDYFSLESRDYVDPLKTSTLLVYAENRCGINAEGVCGKFKSVHSPECPVGMKDAGLGVLGGCGIVTPTEEYGAIPCCIEDPYASVGRCGPTTNPRMGVCEKTSVDSHGLCASTRKATGYQCANSDETCCMPITAEEYHNLVNQVPLYGADMPLYYKGKPGYLRAKSSSTVVLPWARTHIDLPK